VGESPPDYLAWTAPSRAVPLPKALAKHQGTITPKYDLRVPTCLRWRSAIAYDDHLAANKPGEMDRAEAFGRVYLTVCVELGGVLTGEPGCRNEKETEGEMFSDTNLNSRSG